MRVGGSAAVSDFGGRLHVGRMCCVLGGTLYWCLAGCVLGILSEEFLSNDAFVFWCYLVFRFGWSVFGVGSTGSAVRTNGTVLNVRFNSAQVGTILVSRRGGPVTRKDRA